MFGDKLGRYRREFDQGETIFQEDDWGKNLLVVDEGKIEIVKNNNGSEQTVATIGPGGIIGEMVFASGEYRRTATARATTAVSGWKLQEDQVEGLLENNATFRQKLFSVLTRRLERTTDKVADLLDLRDRQIRLVLLLFALLEESDITAEGTFSKEISLTPEFLAHQFRTSYERIETLFEDHTGRELSEMENEDRRKNRAVADRVLSELLAKLDLYAPDRTTKESETRAAMVETLRQLEDSLEDLDDPEEAFTRGQFKDVKKERARAEKLLDEYRSLESSKALEKKIETIISSIDVHLRKFNPEDFVD